MKEKRKCTALELSNYVLNEAIKQNMYITNWHLQYLLYYIQIEQLKSNGEVAFYDDIEAWQIGPVIPSVYYSFCTYASFPIADRHFISNINFEEVEIPNILIVKKVLEKQGRMCISDLVLADDEANSPYHIIREKYGSKNIDIPITLLAGQGK